jgi:LacI family transcriptional regulator
MSVLHPRISSIHQPVEAVGRAIWQLLHKQLQGESSEPVHLRMKADLRVRESTAPPHKATGAAQQNAGRTRKRAALADR